MSFKSISDLQPPATPYITLHQSTQPGLSFLLSHHCPILDLLCPFWDDSPASSLLLYFLYALLFQDWLVALLKLLNFALPRFQRAWGGLLCVHQAPAGPSRSSVHDQLTSSEPKNELLSFQWTPKTVLVLDVPMLPLSSAPLRHLLDVRESSP